MHDHTSHPTSYVELSSKPTTAPTQPVKLSCFLIKSKLKDLITDCLELIDLAWMEMLTERIRCTSLGQRLFNLHVMLIFVMFLRLATAYSMLKRSLPTRCQKFFASTAFSIEAISACGTFLPLAPSVFLLLPATPYFSHQCPGTPRERERDLASMLRHDPVPNIFLNSASAAAVGTGACSFSLLFKHR